jgi:hypothetical protein
MRAQQDRFLAIWIDRDEPTRVTFAIADGERDSLGGRRGLILSSWLPRSV